MQRYRLPSDYCKNHRITIKSLISKRSYYPRVQFIPKKKKKMEYISYLMAQHPLIITLVEFLGKIIEIIILFLSIFNGMWTKLHPQ